MITLTRRYHFSASHRLHSAALGEAENARLYGKCNNPYGHGHDYVLEVTVAGNIDETTGLLLPIARLDRLVQNQVLHLFSHRNLNLDLPQFARLVPTTENVALVIAELLERQWHLLNDSQTGTAPRLHRVHVQETDRNGFEVLIGAPQNKSLLDFQHESVTVNA